MITTLSPYLIAIAAGWLLAQGAKYLVDAVRKGSFRNIRQLYLSGNMPSSHSATVVALTTVVALKDGIDSGLFAVAVLFAGVVMYDAMMVRRSSGEQGLALQELMKTLKSNAPIPRAAKGHTPLEVLAGAILGACIGTIVFFATV